MIFSEGPTKYNIDNKYDIESENVYFDRAKKIIFGDKEAIIEDNERNIFKLKEKYKILVDEEIIKSKKSLILDKNDNTYILRFSFKFENKRNLR